MDQVHRDLQKEMVLHMKMQTYLQLIDLLISNGAMAPVKFGGLDKLPWEDIECYYKILEKKAKVTDHQRRAAAYNSNRKKPQQHSAASHVNPG
jgi:hypothetical protein